MNCKDFKNQYTAGHEFGVDLSKHVASCQECQTFAAEEEKLSALLGSLEKRDAPADFGTAVRSRIDERKRPAVRLWGFAKVFVPVAAVVLLVGFVFFNSGTLLTKDKAESLTAKNSVDVARNEDLGDDAHVSPPAATPEAAESSESAREDVALIEKVQSPQSDAQTEKASASRKNDSVAKSEKPKLDSIDMSFEESEVENPPGIEPNQPVVVAPEGPKQKFTAREILSTLGIATVWRGTKLFVTGVTDNSIAEISGIKTGDRVVSIDGKSIGVDTFSRGSVSGRVVTVRRAGKDIKVSLKNSN